MYSVYTSGQLYIQDSNKGSTTSKLSKNTLAKRVFVFGDTPCDPSNKNHLALFFEEDDFQANTVSEVLFHTATSEKKSAFVIEGSRAESMRAMDCLYQKIENFENRTDGDELLIGIRTRQAIRASLYSKLGSVHYYFTDRSGKGLLGLVQSIEIIERYLKFRRIAQENNDGFTRNKKKAHISLFIETEKQDTLKGELLKSDYDFLRLSFNEFVSNVTVKELKRKIEKVTIKEIDKVVGKKSTNHQLIENAKGFLVNYADDALVREIFLDFFMNKSLSEVQSEIQRWIYPLHYLLKEYGFKVVLHRILKQYQSIVISCHHDTAQQLPHYFKKRNYKEQENYNNDRVVQPLAQRQFTKLINCYKNDAGWKFRMNTCDGCTNLEIKQNQFFKCIGCKSAWYCSEECQKNCIGCSKLIKK